MISGGHSEEDFKRARTNIEYIDPLLTELGLQQCEAASEITNKLKVEIVLISPMARTMQTAYNVFKNHPNLNNIEFIVVPNLKELLGSAPSIPKDIVTTINQYKDKLPNINSSLLQDYNDLHHYYLEDIDDDFAKKILLEVSKCPEDPFGSNSVELTIEHIKSSFPGRPESCRSVLKRIGKVQKLIYNLLQSKFGGDSSKIISEDSKIIVVSHGIYGRIWTGKWDKPLEEYDDIPMPSKYKDLQNCELYADNKNFPRLSSSLH